MSTRKIVSDVMFSGRVLSHGQITSLASAFTLDDNQPFSLFIIPIDEAEYLPITAVVQCFFDETATACPFNLNCWNEPAIISVSASAIDLTKYTVYWGSGSDVSQS